MGKPNDRVIVNVRLSKAALDRLDKIAEDCFSTRSEVFRRALIAGLDDAEKMLRREFELRAAGRSA